MDHIISWYPDVINYQWKVMQKFYADELFLGGYMMDIGYRKRNKIPKIEQN